MNRNVESHFALNPTNIDIRRSTFDRSHSLKTSFNVGDIVPFFIDEVALPGDTFDIDLEANVLTHPTSGPLFGSYKLQLDVFEAPIRLYNSLMHNNMLGIGLDINRVKLPIIQLSFGTINLSLCCNSFLFLSFLS